MGNARRGKKAGSVREGRHPDWLGGFTPLANEGLKTAEVGSRMDWIRGEGMPECRLHTDSVNTNCEGKQYTVRLGERTRKA